MSSSRARPALLLPHRLAVELIRQQHVLERGERGDELVGLEDEADGSAAHLRELVFGQIADGSAVEVHLAAGRRVQPGEQAQQRALTRARGAHDGDKLSRRHLEVDPFQDLHRTCPIADRLAKIPNLDHCR